MKEEQKCQGDWHGVKKEKALENGVGEAARGQIIMGLLDHGNNFLLRRETTKGCEQGYQDTIHIQSLCGEE